MFGSLRDINTLRSPRALADHPVVALRCALRSFSALGGLADNPVHPQGDESEALFVATLRGVVIAWASHLYELPASSAEQASHQLGEAVAAFDPKLATHYEHWDGFHEAMIASQFHNLDHARKVSGFVGLALSAPFSGTTSNFLEDAFDTSAFQRGDESWRAWNKNNRAAAEADIAALRAGTSAAILVQERLWTEPSHEALAVAMASLRWWRLPRNHWMPQYVEAWLRERTPGALVLGRSAQASNERIRQIVALPDQFWRGRPAEDVLDGLNYAFDGSLNNPHWGEISPSSQRLRREESKATELADHLELTMYRQSANVG